MQLKILLPFGVFASFADVTSIGVMTPAGSFGLLPHRLDCATVLSPGLLSYSAATAGEKSEAATAIKLVAGVEAILTAAPNRSASTLLSPWSLNTSGGEGEAAQ